MVIGCLMGFVYYQRTRNITASLGICVVSPFIITILISILLRLWNKALGKGKSVSPLSCLLGSVFSVLWGGSYLVLLLILIGILPIRSGWLKNIQDDVSASKSYTIINHLIAKKTPLASLDVKRIANIFEDPSKLEKLESTREFKTLMADERLKNLFADEETAEQIRNKDYGKLLSNPKMQAVFEDKNLLEKMFSLNKKIIDEQMGGEFR